MSMITRCPACDTMFRVVPDQLRISAGWVRCGKCHDIFDASLQLVDPPPAGGPPWADTVVNELPLKVSENSPAVPAVPLRARARAPVPEVPLSIDPPKSNSSDAHTVDLNLNDVAAEWRATAELLEAAGATTVEHSEKVDVAEIDAVTAVDETVLNAEIEVENSKIDEPQKTSPTSLALPLPVESISFLSKDSEAPVRARPARRWFLVVLIVLLFLALMSQGVYRERNNLAAKEPRLAPWLARACEALDCSVGPVQKIDAISVESSTFVKLRGDTYRLSFTLKNSAPLSVAFPAIELTLTDALDRPLLRRVLQASDMNSTSTVLSTGAEWPTSIDIEVQPTAMPERVAGYRLVVFYP